MEFEELQGGLRWRNDHRDHARRRAAGAKHYKFAPPRIGGRSEIAACIEVIDGGKTYRYIIPRAMQMEGVQTDLGKAKEAVLPLRLAVQGGDDADAWYLITNDPAFANAA